MFDNYCLTFDERRKNFVNCSILIFSRRAFFEITIFALKAIDIFPYQIYFLCTVDFRICLYVIRLFRVMPLA